MSKYWLVLVCAVMACSGTQTIRDRMGSTYGECLDGDLDACHAFAKSQRTDNKEEVSQHALVAWQYACLRDHQPSCAEIGAIYQNDRFVVDESRKRAALFSSCDAGELDACVTIADTLPRFQAKPFYERACEGNIATACTSWASILRQTWRLESHLVKALELEEKACELGDPMGCFNAGQAYLFGSGIDIDTEKAESYFAKSCNDNTGAGCRALGKIYQDGLGVRADINEANRYYDIAQTHKSVDRKQTRRSAYLLFVNACNYGDVLGCFNAGWFNAEGVEVQRNISTSRTFFERSCSEGLKSACKKWREVQPAQEGRVTREEKKRDVYEVDSKGNRVERP